GGGPGDGLAARPRARRAGRRRRAAARGGRAPGDRAVGRDGGAAARHGGLRREVAALMAVRMGDLVAFLRNTWRGLTSMRTALALLFLLALGALPGALLPQRSLNAPKVEQYITEHGWWGRL